MRRLSAPHAALSRAALLAIASWLGLSAIGCEPAPTTPVTVGEKIKSKHATTGEGLSPGGAAGMDGSIGSHGAEKPNPTMDQLGKAEGDLAPHGVHGARAASVFANLAPDKVILVVDEQQFTKADLDRSLAQAAGLAGIPPNMLDNQMRAAFEAPAYEKLIERTLLAKEAKKRGLWPTDAVAKQKRDEMLKTLPEGKSLDDVLAMMGATQTTFDNDLKVDIAIAELLKKLEAEQKPVGDDVVKGIYEQNKSVFTVPDTAAAAHILIKVDRAAGEEVVKQRKAAAEAILKEVKGKDDMTFARVAREKSEDPSGQARDGDLGLFKRGDLFPEFEEAAFKLKEGEIVGPIRTDRGFHIIRGGGVEKGRTLPAAEAYKIIRERERVKSFMDAVDTLMTRLRGEAKIERVVSPQPSPLMEPGAQGLRVPSWRATGKNAAPGMMNPHAP